MDMQPSELRVWLVALSASVLVHVAIIGYYDLYLKSLIGEPNKARVPTINLTLERVEPKPLKTRNTADKKPELFATKKPENIPPEKKQPETAIAEVKKPEAKQPEPAIVKVNKPEVKQPEPAIAEVKKPEVKQHEPLSEETSQPKVMATASMPPPVSDDLKNEYIRLLMADIDAHKYYPRRARNRGIEGIVKISFELLNNGDVTNIQISGGHRMLRAAAKHAIDQTLPLQRSPPPYMQLPLEIHFSMRFEFE